MRDVRIKAWIRAIESRYPGVEVVVEPWTDPDGVRRIRWWLEVLNVRDGDFFPLKELGLRLAYDLYAAEGPTFMFTVNGEKATAAYLARRREVEERERRFRRRKAGLPPPGSGLRRRRLARAGRN